MTRLDGRVAIVTGAGRGIGRSVARLLASQGAAMVVADLGVAMDGSGRDSGPAAEVVEEIAAAGGKAITTAPTSTTSPPPRACMGPRSSSSAGLTCWSTWRASCATGWYST